MQSGTGAEPQYVGQLNDWSATVLPPPDQMASETSTSGFSVHAVYENGIDFISDVEDFGAPVAGVFWASALAVLLSYAWIAQANWVDIFSSAMFGLVACFLFMLGRENAVGWRYHPILFDRAAQKVHVFTDLGSPWWEFWRLLGGTRHRIDSFDWSCARGEVTEISMRVGADMVHTQYMLGVAITDVPGGDNLVARLSVGFPSAYDFGDLQIMRWEHIRRYMRGEGPALTPGDSLHPHDGDEHWVGAFTSGQPLLGPGSKVWWTGEVWHGAWPLTVPLGLASLFIFPLTLPYSVIRWLVLHYKPVPCWPASIRGSIGADVIPESLLRQPESQPATGQLIDA